MLNYYGAEAWVLNADITPIKRIYLFALKRFLNTSLSTSNVMVFDETGRYPLFENIHDKCIKCWLRILKMSPHRLPFKTYKLLLHLHKQNKETLVSSVGYVLYNHDCIEVWVNQGVGNEKAF